MDFRFRRQLAVLGVVSLALAGIAFLVFSANAPKPTCEDKTKNQGEEEADCGGPCIPCAFRVQKPVEVFWTRFIQTRGNAYDVAAEIRNPNVKLGAASFEYELKLYDTAGVLVASQRGKSFLYPGETTHLVGFGLSSGRVIRGAAVTIGNVRWVPANTPGPDVVAGSKEYTVETENGVRRSAVKAIITNRGITDVHDITVNVLAFNERGNLLGVHQTVLGKLAAGASQPVKLAWPAVLPEAVASIVVEARSPSDLPPRPMD